MHVLHVFLVLLQNGGYPPGLAFWMGTIMKFPQDLGVPNVFSRNLMDVSVWLCLRRKIWLMHLKMVMIAHMYLRFFVHVVVVCVTCAVIGPHQDVDRFVAPLFFILDLGPKLWKVIGMFMIMFTITTIQLLVYDIISADSFECWGRETKPVEHWRVSDRTCAWASCLLNIYTYNHAHTYIDIHTHTYIYMYMCVCDVRPDLICFALPTYSV